MSVNLHFGYVSNIDNQGRSAVVIPAMDDFVTDYLPVIKSRSLQDKDGNVFDINEPVAVLLDENGEDGIILGAINTDSNPLPIVDRNKHYLQFADGTNIEYDRETHVLTADIKGTANITAQTINVIGNAVITGDLSCTGSVNDGLSTLGIIRDVFNNHTHTGNAGVPTSTPSELMQ
jgi:phage baseplate assembly protein V